jgi:hypothetical protein
VLIYFFFLVFFCNCINLKCSILNFYKYNIIRNGQKVGKSFLNWKKNVSILKTFFPLPRIFQKKILNNHEKEML